MFKLLGENVLTYFVSAHTESFPLLLEKKHTHTHTQPQSTLEIYNRGDPF